MVDTDVIKRLIVFYKQEYNDLKKHDAISFSDYEKNRSIQAEVERRFETTIQTAIDIGNHIIAQKEYASPKTYRDIFKILNDNKIIDDALSEKLQDFAGFRNILVHEYREILIKRVYKKLTEDLSFLNEYIKQIIYFIEKEK